ncbi:LysE family transporter [Paenochrobactrum sp. BZR 588]|uniref:LysE family transporter n=1 Tax=unclassified Paenochrobactrum TaxID=2639760 RepID=UPI003852F5F8
MQLVLAGVGALLASSATAFMLLKWAGAFYLIWLGILAIRSSHMNANDTDAAINPISASLAFRSNILTAFFILKQLCFLWRLCRNLLMATMHTGRRPYC